MTRDRLRTRAATRLIPSASGDVPLQPGGVAAVHEYARSIVAQVQEEINAAPGKVHCTTCSCSAS
jgi:hypothetical protein